MAVVEPVSTAATSHRIAGWFGEVVKATRCTRGRLCPTDPDTTPSLTWFEWNNREGYHCKHPERCGSEKYPIAYDKVAVVSFEVTREKKQNAVGDLSQHIR